MKCRKCVGVGPLALVLLALAVAAPLAVGADDGRPGYLGVGFSLDRETGRVSVRHVVPGGPSARHGVQAGDVLTHVAGADVRFPSQGAVLGFFEHTAVIGRPLRMTYERESQPLEFLIRPVGRPEDLAGRNAARLRCLEGSGMAAQRPGR
jgi:S1-C subfamily serine protease